MEFFKDFVFVTTLLHCVLAYPNKFDYSTVNLNPYGYVSHNPIQETLKSPSHEYMPKTKTLEKPAFIVIPSWLYDNDKLPVEKQDVYYHSDPHNPRLPAIALKTIGIDLPEPHVKLSLHSTKGMLPVKIHQTPAYKPEPPSRVIKPSPNLYTKLILSIRDKINVLKSIQYPLKPMVRNSESSQAKFKNDQSEEIAKTKYSHKSHFSNGEDEYPSLTPEMELPDLLNPPDFDHSPTKPGIDKLDKLHKSMDKGKLPAEKQDMYYHPDPHKPRLPAIALKTIGIDLPEPHVKLGLHSTKGMLPVKIHQTPAYKPEPPSRVIKPSPNLYTKLILSIRDKINVLKSIQYPLKPMVRNSESSQAKFKNDQSEEPAITKYSYESHFSTGEDEYPSLTPKMELPDLLNLPDFDHSPTKSGIDKWDKHEGTLKTHKYQPKDKVYSEVEAEKPNKFGYVAENPVIYDEGKPEMEMYKTNLPNEYPTSMKGQSADKNIYDQHSRVIKVTPYVPYPVLKPTNIGYYPTKPVEMDRKDLMLPPVPTTMPLRYVAENPVIYDEGKPEMEMYKTNLPKEYPTSTKGHSADKNIYDQYSRVIKVTPYVPYPVLKPTNIDYYPTKPVEMDRKDIKLPPVPTTMSLLRRIQLTLMNTVAGLPGGSTAFLDSVRAR